MQITITILFFVIISFLIPKRYLKAYAYLSSIIIASLYFFFDPPSSYDLSRHYEMFENMKTISLKEIVIQGNDVIRSYFSNYPVYTIYLWFISRFHIRELLPFSVAMIVYSINFIILNDLDERLDLRKGIYSIGYAIIVLGYNYIAFSGVRNVLAVSLFVLALYYDLVKKEKKILCYCIYVLTCLIHSVCVIYFVIRIGLMFYNKATKLLIKIGILLIFTLIPFIYANKDIYYFLVGNKVIKHALVLFYNYFMGDTGGADLKGMYILAIALYSFTFLIALYTKKYVTNIDIYSKFYDYFILSLLFTIGAYSQYDIFVRYQMMVIPFLLCFSVEMLNSVHKKSLFIVSGNSKIENYLYIIMILYCICAFGYIILYRFIYQYNIVTQYF